MKSAAAVALLATLTSACTMSRPARGVAIASGVALAFTGMAVAADADVSVDSDGNGVNDNPFNDNLDDLDDQLAGMALVGLGLALITAGAAASDPREAAIDHSPSTPGPRPASVTWTPAPRASLPEVATTDVVLRMAQQTRAAALRGNCDAAWSTWDSIRARDERYAAALADSAVLAPCPRVALSARR